MPKEYTLIGGNGTRVSPLEVNESGTYEAGDSRAFNPVKVNVPSGSSTLSGLTDVDISNPADGQVLVYNAETGKWENGTGGGGGLVVNVIEHNDGEYSSLDKTAGEIYSAFINGNNISFRQSQEDEGVISYYLGLLRSVEYGVFEEGPYAGMGYYNFDVVAVRNGQYFIDNEFQTIGEDTYPVSNFAPPV